MLQIDIIRKDLVHSDLLHINSVRCYSRFLLLPNKFLTGTIMVCCTEYVVRASMVLVLASDSME